MRKLGALDLDAFVVEYTFHLVHDDAIRGLLYSVKPTWTRLSPRWSSR